MFCDTQDTLLLSSRTHQETGKCSKCHLFPGITTQFTERTALEENQGAQTPEIKSVVRSPQQYQRRSTQQWKRTSSLAHRRGCSRHLLMEMVLMEIGR